MVLIALMTSYDASLPLLLMSTNGDAPSKLAHKQDKRDKDSPTGVCEYEVEQTHSNHPGINVEALFGGNPQGFST